MSMLKWKKKKLKNKLKLKKKKYSKTNTSFVKIFSLSLLWYKFIWILRCWIGNCACDKLLMKLMKILGKVHRGWEIIWAKGKKCKNTCCVIANSYEVWWRFRKHNKINNYLWENRELISEVKVKPADFASAMKSRCGAITWLNLSPLQTGQWDGNKRSPRDQLQSQLIPITSVEINREGSEWRRWESDESASALPAPPLLSASGAEEEGVTKARVWSVIRKGQMSHIGPGLHPARSAHVAIQRSVERNQEKPLRWRCPSLWYECDCVLLVIQNAGVYF